MLKKSIKVYLFTGLLQSGKTSVINNLIKKLEDKNLKIEILSLEKGKSSYKRDEIYIKSKNYDSSFLNVVLNKDIDLLFIEFNGLLEIKSSIDFMQKNNIKIEKIIYIVNEKNKSMFNLKALPIIQEQIQYSDEIWVNSESNSFFDYIKNLNTQKKIVKFDEEKIFECLSDKKDKKSFLFLGLVILYMIFQSMPIIYEEIQNTMSDNFKYFVTLSIGLSLQGIGYLFLASIFSTILEIKSIFNFNLLKRKNPIFSIIISLFIGILIPVCDCMIIPICNKIAKKGMPVYVWVAFLLSAPIINPISIISTYSAFSNDISIVFIRVFTGILIAFLTALSFYFFPINSVVLMDKKYDDLFQIESELWIKISSKFSKEVFQTIRFYMFGVFVASFLQAYIPFRSLIIFKNDFVKVFFMMILAYMLSLCSSSDAFIARGLILIVGKSSILSFLIFGAMIDVKNTIFLMKFFKKIFIIRIFLTVLVLNLLIFGVLFKL